MKILYVPIMNPETLESDKALDYQSDTLFYGLRKLFGDDVVDIMRLWFMYKKDKLERPENFKELWGKAFTCYGLLGDDSKVDREDLGSKIANHFFDFIIMPMHWSVHSKNEENKPGVHQFLDQVLEHYPPSRVALIDGWDRQDIDLSISRRCVYFKRELSDRYKNEAFPISFSVPLEQVRSSSEKSIDFAPLIPSPNHLDTYIYDDEKSYYDDYNKSYFAFTSKKGRMDDLNNAWDCLRHYEIMAADCIPFFTNVEECPKYTLYSFPKDLCVEAKKLPGVYPGVEDCPPRPEWYERYQAVKNPKEDVYIGPSTKILHGELRGRIDFDKFDRTSYLDLKHRFREHLLKHLTCEQIATKLINTMIRINAD